MSEVRKALERITAAFEAVVKEKARPAGRAHAPFMGDFSSALPYPGMLKDITRWAAELRAVLDTPPKCSSKVSLMSLEDAILHAQEKGLGGSACSAEHLQLAAWLIELRSRRLLR